MEAAGHAPSESKPGQIARPCPRQCPVGEGDTGFEPQRSERSKSRFERARRAQIPHRIRASGVLGRCDSSRHKVTSLVATVPRKFPTYPLPLSEGHWGTARGTTDWE